MEEPISTKPDLSTSSRLIPLTNSSDLHIICDVDDFNELSIHKWHIDKKGYAYTTIGGCFIKFHHAVMGQHKGKHVDHINNIRLDNRRENLRVCLPSENMRNRPKYKGEYSSQYKGVSWNKRDNRWQVLICVDSTLITITSTENEIEAAAIYNTWAKELHGEFASFNTVEPMFLDIDVSAELERRKLGVRSDNKSGFRGVNFCKKKQKWRAYYNINYKQIFVGYYKTAEEAYLAKLSALKKIK